MKNSFWQSLAIILFGVFSMQSVNAEDLNTELKAAFEKGELPGLHGAMAEYQGKLLAEVYFEGEDERWGQSIGSVKHGPETLHDLRSVTKSVVGLLYGIALGEGKVPEPSTALYDQFPEYPDLANDPERGGILIEHVLSMQMGLEWNEDLPYSDPRNSEIAMEMAQDRFRYILEQPIREAPGQSWIYSGGAAALIGRLIEKGTGQSLDDYAAEKLFGPLGIKGFEWIAGDDGVISAASGLRMTLPDLMKIGRMVANDGEGIVPEEWLEASFEPKVTIHQHSRYGYLWYLSGPDNEISVAVGNGGQRLTVQPARDFVVASFAGRYNDSASWQTSLKVLLDFAVPAAKRVSAK
ncbi:beta-lactamase [Roseibium sp. TrichSKD4]|uniref:serine hydrolase domain-containing protein n=1 Tax=Roseibium sp. TrichSKD4 TaxID=744980 RepID=UPI0001E57515|nr:serine hydrolase [Roseibium sp. TrichSKD4]EFO30847.1 beta-lactamase [Roseibium sp. TrichSKD4]